MKLLSIDWQSLFAMDTSIGELFIIGSVLYIGILILMRLMPRRTGAEISLMDMIWVLLITEAASHSMGNYSSLTDGIILIAIYMGWDYLINILKQHIPAINNMLSVAPLPVVRDGKMIPANMRKEFLNKDELLSSLREQGIEDVSEVKKAFVESEGQITVIKFEKSDQKKKPKKP